MSQYKRICTVYMVCIISLAAVSAEVFTFKYSIGDVSRILSTVNEQILINGQYSHTAEIVNRIVVDITDVQGEWASHSATFMTSEQNTSYGFSWGEEYHTLFKRNGQGVYDIGKEYYMPVVRNVPVFSTTDVKVGDTWTACGEEVHDLRRNFGIVEPFRVPFDVTYTYDGTETKDGVLLHRILAQYTLFYTNPKPASEIAEYPAHTMGFSNQIIYWDNEKGAIDFYTEEFRIVLELNTGLTIEFRGTAQAEVDILKKHTAQNLQEVQTSVADAGIENAVVTSDDKGITISLEDIQFLPNSNMLRESEKEKLQKLSALLKSYESNDLLITGHTALAGNEDDRLVLSAQRAQAVADYLIKLGVKDAYHIFTQGKGAVEPVSDNSTEEGKARNRRVEITILNK